MVNDPERIVLSGALKLTRDKAGLAAALALQQAIASIVDLLQHDPALPDTSAMNLPHQRARSKIRSKGDPWHGARRGKVNPAITDNQLLRWVTCWSTWSCCVSLYSSNAIVRSISSSSS
ncbi:hypothetical protein [Burkholderia cepacia]|uniref:hypothetical protein n=1 Tax=Burkholderia cepacia TaxID=292 RepID=UPI002AB77B00|nr:hypothetical protein [Burkholderia cepacia]